MPKYSEEYIKRRRDWWIAGSKFVSDANYKKAVKHCKLGLKLFPNDVIVEFRLYAVQSDFYLTENKAKSSPEIKKCISKMSRCLKRTKGLPDWSKNYMKNEYYFQTQQFKKQYALGIDQYKNTKDKYELYSSGVGGANYALELANRGQLARAKIWAKRSIKAWDIYFKVDKKYYNPYVHYALAWGILGEHKKMMKALQTSSKRCGKPITYKEFQEVINAIRKI